MIGKTINNNYTIKSEIGEGGMGVVYYAEGNYGLKVAIKMLKPELANDPKLCSRFIKEAKSMIQLQGHPNIVHIYAVAESESQPALIMEYLEGGCDLYQYVQSKGIVKDGDLLRKWLSQLLYALDYAHHLSPKLIHRDIKPSNLFLTRFGDIKLLDFGIVRIIEECKDSNQTEKLQTTILGGSKNYMSPEQGFDPQLVDERSDIYSIGKTLEYLLTSDNPYADITLEPFKTIVEKATQKNPRNRFQSCGELLLFIGEENQKSTAGNSIVTDKKSTVGEKTSPSQDRRQAESGIAPSNKLVEMVKVEGGTFRMGGKDDKPTHSVTLSTYYIGKYPVTQRQWNAVMGNNPSYFKGDDLPVENVSWFDVIKYCNALNKREGYEACYRINGTTVEYRGASAGYRLPTEAEWEFAARGGNKKDNCEYSGSNNLGDVAWYTENSNQTHAVGKKKPNGLGLYDMSGNVWEWCWDWYGTYSSSSQTNPLGATSGSGRVYRGGSWLNSASRCTVSSRYSVAPGFTFYYLGFRLAFACSSK